MIRTDKESIEKLSAALTEWDITHLNAMLSYMQREELLTIPQEKVQQALVGLDMVADLKLGKRVYAFHAYDRFNQGVELYLRQAEGLKGYCVPDEDCVFCQPSDSIPRLRHDGYTRIYTCDIRHTSLDIQNTAVSRMSLREAEEIEFRMSGISVIRLDELL